MNIRNNLNSKDSNRFFIIILTLILSSVFAIVYIISRIGFGEIEQDAIVVLKTLFLSYFLILFPYILIRLLVIIKFKKLRLFPGLESLLTFITIIFVTLVGFLNRKISFNLLFILAALGFIFVLILLIDYKLNYLNRLLSLPVVLIISGLIIWFMGARWGSIFFIPFYPESIINESAHADILFHSAVTNMIRTYGIPGIGIDGLVPISYHYGSHWIFAQFDELINIGGLKFYQLGFPIIFIPLLLKTFLMVILDIKSLYGNDKYYNIKKDNIFWVILSFGFIGILPQYLNRFFGVSPKFLKIAYNNKAMLGSESYLVSIIFIFLLISALVFFENNQCSNRIFSILKNLFYLILFPIFIAIIGFTKVSLMVILVVVLFYLFFRKKYYKNKVYIISLILLLASSFLVLFFTLNTNLQSSDFNPTYWLNLLSIFKDKNLLITYLGLILRLILISIWAIFFIFLVVLSKKVKKFNLFLKDSKKNKTIEIEIILIVAIVGFLPFFITNSSGVFYFYDIQRWIAIILILSCLNTKYISDKTIIRINSNKKRIKDNFFKILLISIVSFLIIFNVFDSPYNYLRFNHSLRKNIVENLLKEDNGIMLSRYKLLEILNSLNQMPLEIKRQTIIYVPQSNNIYWDLNVFRGDSFIIPAVTGIVMIDGMPEIDGDSMPSWYYGYSDYQQRLTSKDYSIGEIYDKAEEKGFKYLIIINYSNDELSLFEINPDNINDYRD